MKLSDFDLNLMRVFLTVYHFQSITVAAEVLDLTQPGVSGALKRLQNQLGQQLFVRDGRGIAPTHLAHEMARQIEPALEAIENTLNDAQEFSVEGKRRFVVYTTEPVMLNLVPKIEADKSLGNCEIVLSPTTVTEAQLREKLNLRQADLAIEFSESSTSSYFTQSFFSDQICLIASKQHPRIQGAISALEYYQEKHITLKLRREEIFLVDYFTKEHIQPRNVTAECESLLALMALVGSSESIGMTSLNMAKQFSEQFGLQILPVPFSSLPVNYVLMGHKREQNSKANIWLREKLLSYVQN